MNAPRRLDLLGRAILLFALVMVGAVVWRLLLTGNAPTAILMLGICAVVAVLLHDFW